MEFIIITGMSGAGKSRAVAALEDVGFYCIDNMPPSMIPKFAEMCFQSGGKISKVAFVTDGRGANMFERFFEGLDELHGAGYEYKILYLDASDATLIKRYKETRRKHPFADMFEGSVSKAIDYERKILEPMKNKADFVVDTTKLSPLQLKDHLLGIFLEGHNTKIVVNVMSFGFKYGVPLDADLMFDVRCFPNPFYVDELKAQTGLDEPVRDYVMKSEQAREFMGKLYDMVDFLMPLYVEEGKTQLVISIGCTGGRHRSVAMAEALAGHINGKTFNAVVSHRDITK